MPETQRSETSPTTPTEKEPRPNLWMWSVLAVAAMVTLAIIAEDSWLRVIAIIAAVSSAVNGVLQFRRELKWHREHG